MEKDKFGFYSMPANSSWLNFFINAMATRNYFNYKGRASRSEYWAVTIFCFIINCMLSASLVTMQLSSVEDDVMSSYYSYMMIEFVGLYFYIPQFTLSVRRFHDINMSAWWGLLIIPLLFLPFFKGDKGDNQYGKNIYV